MNPIWEGYISFGLVNIPVKLYSASRKKELSFHLLDKKFHQPVEYKRYCEKCQKEVGWDEIVKGYEFEKGKYVEVGEEDFKKLDPKLTRTINISEFVDLAQIDPAYFDKPYFLVPEKESEKAYFLLVKAMNETGRVALGKVVIKTREYLAVIKPEKNGLLLETMYFSDEVRSIDEFKLPKTVSYSPEEYKMTKQIIASMSSRFDAKKFKDVYKEKMMELIRHKIAGKEIKVAEQKVTPPTTSDKISEALEKTLRELAKENKKELAHK